MNRTLAAGIGFLVVLGAVLYLRRGETATLPPESGLAPGPGGSVFGLVAGRETDQKIRGHVILRHKGVSSSGGIHWVWEAMEDLQGDPAFRFTDVGPGAKWLNAHWIHGPDVYFAVRTFELLPRTDMDLSVLDIAQAHSVRGIVNLVDLEGNRQPVADLAGIGARVFLEAQGSGVAGLLDFVDIRIGEEFSFHGLAAGRYAISSDEIFEPERLGEWAIVDRTVGTEIVVPRDGTFELSIPVSRTLETVVTASVQSGASRDLPTYCIGTFVRADGVEGKLGFSRTLENRYNLFQARGKLPIGEYRYVISAGGSELSYGSTGTLSAKGPGIVELDCDLVPAASVRGRLVDGLGVPRAEGVVQLAPREWIELGFRVWPHGVRADEAGYFVVEGLIPGMEYAVKYSETIVTPASAGSETNIGDVRMGR